MPDLTIDTDQIRVIQADNYKGNPRVYIEIMDQRVLYSDPWVLSQSEEFSWVVEEDEFGHIRVRTNLIEMTVQAVIGRFWQELLLKDKRIAAVFSIDTDREIDYTKPRVEVKNDDPYA